MRKNTGSSAPPEGFRYQADVLPLNEEQELVERIQELPLKEFEFHGYFGKRRVLSYGWHYDFGERTLQPTDEIPPFLHKLRERAGAFADLAADHLPHAPRNGSMPSRDIYSSGNRSLTSIRGTTGKVCTSRLNFVRQPICTPRPLRTSRSATYGNRIFI